MSQLTALVLQRGNHTLPEDLAGRCVTGKVLLIVMSLVHRKSLNFNKGGRSMDHQEMICYYSGSLENFR